MPDIVLGALIGVVSAALGAVITGIINHRNAKLQINARRDELNQQLSHQEREAQRNSLIEARKDLLLPLRNAISEWVECSHQVTNMTVRFKNALKEDKASPSRQLETKEFWEVMERGKRLSSQLRILHGQISDDMLDKRIEALRKTQYEVDLERMPLLRFVNNPGSADIDTLEAALQKDESVRKKVWNQVVQVNKRIEELLIGEPST